MHVLSLPRSSRPILVGCSALLLAVAGPGAAQEVASVAGRVVSTIATGRPDAVPGVTIRFPGLGLRAVTGEDGRFAFAAVPAGRHEVRAEVVGCELASRLVDVRRDVPASLDFVLVRPAIEVPGVVATGAPPGQLPDDELPFAVGRIDAEALERRSARTIADLIRGEFPGVRIVQGSGLPGSETSIQLRGAGSITGEGDPLVVVDGTVAIGGLIDLNPREVRSIRVLRGAAAAALYGSRGQAGVIEIGTVRGAAEPPAAPGPLLLVDGALSGAGLAEIDPAEIESIEMAAGRAAAVLLGAPAVRTGVMRITTRAGSPGARAGRCSPAAPSSDSPKERVP